MIQFLNENTDLPAINLSQVRSWIQQVAAQHGKTAGDIAYLFCDDAKILEVNRQYLQHDYYTDIITFDYSTGKVISGDIYISLDTVETNALQYKCSFDKELHRVIIHGILHLCGYDDTTPELQLKMTELENESLLMLEPANGGM
ncbi:MAG: rRNA maturation RNase YbeY [Paludibacter sp.]|jgi:rRNA maturation RNase YbeY|nr:rRNA maturation RNase YbeY [Paludibacter sp.]